MGDAPRTTTPSESDDAGRPRDGTSPGASATMRATRTFARLAPVTSRGARLRSLLHGWRVRTHFLGHRIGQHLARITRDDHVYLVLLAAMVGVAAGAAAGLLLAWIEWVHRWFPSPGGDGLRRAAWVVALPTAGGVLVGLVRAGVRRFVPVRLVEGVPGVIEAVAVRRGEIRGVGAAVTGVGTGISIASGASVGHEGPSVAIGATVGSVLARFFGLRHRRRVALVGAGAAAGIAAAFNAPLAGVIFAVEIVFGSIRTFAPSSLHTFLPLIVAAVASTFTSYAVMGERSEFAVGGLPPPVPAEIVGYVALAAAAGVVGASFVRTVVAASRWIEERFGHAVWLPAAAGLCVGGLALAARNNEVLGPGAGTIGDSLHGALVWQVAAVLLLAKFLATVVSIAGGAFGGVFMPSLVLGGCVGTLVGTAMQTFLSGPSSGVESYALVGMGAVFAALMHAPLTPIVMIFELTRDYGIILPLMLACILAAFVSGRLGAEPFYRAILHAREVVLPDEREDHAIRRARITELAVPARRVLTPGAGLSEIEQALRDDPAATVFVVDDDGRVAGVVDGRRLARRVVRGELSDASTAADLADTNVPLLEPHDTIAGAILVFARSDLDALPVVDPDGRLVGVLRRADVLGRYADELLSREEGEIDLVTTDGIHEEVVLAAGVVLDHLVVPARLDGVTLADLDLRGRCGVLVVEWRRGDEHLPIDPRAPLRAGDVLSLVGRREGILATRRIEPPAACEPGDR
ncbi:MAG: CBS domain-containing protein [Deltaproteobacteria bacterium]|nr:MAG: CBS domain-containing protein [Deltaproteobacteria bacterium]